MSGTEIGNLERRVLLAAEVWDFTHGPGPEDMPHREEAELSDAVRALLRARDKAAGMSKVDVLRAEVQRMVAAGHTVLEVLPGGATVRHAAAPRAVRLAGAKVELSAAIRALEAAQSRVAQAARGVDDLDDA